MKNMMTMGQGGGEKKIEKEKSKDEILKDLILGLSPKALAERFKQEEAEGNLEPFISFLVNDDALLASVSWWEKWLTNSQVKLFEAAIKDRKLRDAEKLKTDILPLGLEKKFSPEELHAIFSNIGAVQLTYGCSMACKFCGFDALPGAREHISFKQMRSLLEQFGNQFPREDREKYSTFFYYASDPWDYKSEEDGEKKGFEDVYCLAKQFTGVDSSIRSRKTTDKKWINTLGNIGEEGDGRLLPVISTLGLSKIKQQELIEELKEIKVDALENQREERGIGKDSLESKNFSQKQEGIGCFDGVLLTPRGIYSTVQLPISEQHPQGMIIVPFERFCDFEIEVGTRLDEALRYVLPMNRRIEEFGTGERYIMHNERMPKFDIAYEGGLVEFEVTNGKKTMYLQVDKNFIITKVNSEGIEKNIHEYLKEIEKEVCVIESLEYSEKDMDFMWDIYDNPKKSFLYKLRSFGTRGGARYLPFPPGREIGKPEDILEMFRNTRYDHSVEFIPIVKRIIAACIAHQSKKTNPISSS